MTTLTSGSGYSQSQYPAYQSQIPAQKTTTTDELFESIQKSESMNVAMGHLRRHMRAAPVVVDRLKNTEWVKIWPAISEALCAEFPDEDFPSPNAHYSEIRSFMMSHESSHLLARLESLDLSSLDLISVPNILMRCPNLKQLDLSNNPRLEVLPPWMSHLKHLEFLQLQDTAVLSLPESMLDMPALQDIFVNNSLKRRLPPLHEDVHVYGFSSRDHHWPSQNSEEREHGVSPWQLKMRQQAPPELLEKLGLTHPPHYQ